MKDLEQAAEELRQYIKDHPEEDGKYLAYQAVWILHGEDQPLTDMTDMEETPDHDWLYYVLPENEGDPTLCITWEGDVLVGPVQSILDSMWEDHCQRKQASRCKMCKEASHYTCKECPSCGWFKDGSGQAGEPELPEHLGECLEDGGSDRYLWRLHERIPTHNTPSRHTYVFIRLDIVPDDTRPKPYYELPDKVYGSVMAVNVGRAGKEGAKGAMSCLGISEEDWQEMPQEGKAQALLEYGTAACLWQSQDVSCRKMLDAILKDLPGTLMTSGFRLDAPQNAIGSTGWDFMSGDVLAGIRK